LLLLLLDDNVSARERLLSRWLRLLLLSWWLWLLEGILLESILFWLLRRYLSLFL